MTNRLPAAARSADPVVTRLLASTALVGVLVTAPAWSQDTAVTHGDVSADNAPGIQIQLDHGDIRVNADNVATTGDQAPAIDLLTLDGEITLTVSGSVSTTGADSQAISSFASGNILLGVGGDVLTIGDNAYALTASSESGNIAVEVDGHVGTSGTAASAIGLLAHTGDITLSLNSVMTLGNGSVGVDATAFGGDVRVVADSVITMGDYSSGVGLAGRTVELVVTDRIATGGRYAAGIGASGQNITLGFQDVSTAGEFAPGISAVTTGGLLSILGENVLTAGDHSEAVNARANDGAMNIQIGTVETRGLDSSGLELVAMNSDVTVDVGTITVAQNSDAGLDLTTDGGVVDVTVGTVSVAGFGTRGVNIEVDTASPQPGRRHESIDVVATQITTTGEEGYGLNVEIDADDDGGTAVGGNITISAGQVTTAGERAYGIRLADLAGRATTAITVGDVTTEGRYAYGVLANTGAGRLTVTSTGLVSTQGAYADGLRLLSTGDITATVDRAETSGYGAEAVHLTNRWDTADTPDRPTISATVQSAHTTGRRASAVYGSAYGGDVDLRVGTATTLGSESHGVRGYSRDGDVRLITDGLVHTQGSFANGIYAHSQNGAASVFANAVQVDGYRSTGIGASSSSGGQVFVRAFADVLATGENSNGIAALSWPTDPEPFPEIWPPVVVYIDQRVVNTGLVSDQHPDWDVYGNAVLVFGKKTQVTIGENGHLESTHGWAYIAVDRELNGPDGPFMTANEDSVILNGSIAGRVSLGRGNDDFTVAGPADISRMTDVFGGEGFDTLGAFGWTGTFELGVFHDFEALNLFDGADLRLSGSHGGVWSFDHIDMSSARLRLGNGATLIGNIFAYDFAGGRSALGFFDAGSSTSRLVGNITSANGIGLDLGDGRGDDRGVIDGRIDGTAYVNLDIGIGGGAIAEADALEINGDINGDVVLWLNPYNAGTGSASETLTINGAHGDIVLAGGPLVWGGQIFDLEVNGALPVPGKAESARAYAPGSTTASARLVSIGFTAEASGALVLPSILEGLDSTLFTDRTSRRGTSHAVDGRAFWMQARTDGFDGQVDGITFDGDQHAVTLGADLLNRSTDSGRHSLSLMFHVGDSQTDLRQTLAANSRIDVDTRALGIATSWTASDSPRYLDMALWLTDRDMRLGGTEFEAQGFGASVELGTQFAVSSQASLHPHVQVIWSQAGIDGSFEPVSGGLIKPGDAASLRVRAGATYVRPIGERWHFEASAAADLNTRDNGSSVLASGYDYQADVSGMGADARLRLTGRLSGWDVFGDINGRWGGGREAADGLGARLGIARKF